MVRTRSTASSSDRRLSSRNSAAITSSDDDSGSGSELSLSTRNRGKRRVADVSAESLPQTRGRSNTRTGSKRSSSRSTTPSRSSSTKKATPTKTASKSVAVPKVYSTKYDRRPISSRTRSQTRSVSPSASPSPVARRSTRSSAKQTGSQSRSQSRSLSRSTSRPSTTRSNAKGKNAGTKEASKKAETVRGRGRRSVTVRSGSRSASRRGSTSTSRSRSRSRSSTRTTRAGATPPRTRAKQSTQATKAKPASKPRSGQREYLYEGHSRNPSPSPTLDDWSEKKYTLDWDTGDESYLSARRRKVQGQEPNVLRHRSTSRAAYSSSMADQDDTYERDSSTRRHSRGRQDSTYHSESSLSKPRTISRSHSQVRSAPNSDNIRDMSPYSRRIAGNGVRSDSTSRSRPDHKSTVPGSSSSSSSSAMYHQGKQHGVGHYTPASTRSTTHTVQTAGGKTSDLVHGVLCAISFLAFFLAMVYRIAYYTDVSKPRYYSALSDRAQHFVTESQISGNTLGRTLGRAIGSIFGLSPKGPIPISYSSWGPFGIFLKSLRDFYLIDAGGSFGNFSARYLANCQTLFTVFSTIFVFYALLRHFRYLNSTSHRRNVSQEDNAQYRENQYAVDASIAAARNRSSRHDLLSSSSSSSSSSSVPGYGYGRSKYRELDGRGESSERQLNVLSRFLGSLSNSTTLAISSWSYATLWTAIYVLATVLTCSAVTFPLFLSISRQWSVAELRAPQPSLQRLLACFLYLGTAIASAIFTLMAFQAFTHQSLWKTFVGDLRDGIVPLANFWNCFFSAIVVGFMFAWRASSSSTDVLRRHLSNISNRSIQSGEVEYSSITQPPSILWTFACSAIAFFTGLATIPSLYMAYKEYTAYEEEMKYNTIWRQNQSQNVPSAQYQGRPDSEFLSSSATDSLRRHHLLRSEPFASASRVIQAY